MPSERNQTQKAMCCMVPFINTTKKKTIITESSGVFGVEGGEQGVNEKGTR